MINLPFEPAGLFMNILQCILIIKCIVLIIFIMPAGVNLRWAAYGYLLVNVLIIGYHIIKYDVFTFPLYIGIFQGGQIIGYLILQGRIKVSESNTLRIPQKTELITEQI